ncbi:MAG: hypothetical protein DPW09_40995 [Anaerolineae bacterium]|nr:metal-dependent hydrolase [Anaerolineales bacterium]MCQ3979837.1 hypothetical protein [Anaerolineae bacterium]
MRTHSHLLMTAVLNDGLKSIHVPVHPRALLLGSILPDLPLLVLTLGFLARRSWSGVPAAADPICGPHFNDLYFHHPFWIAAHNLLHAPLLIGLLAWLGYHPGLRRQKKGGLALFWFALACGFHALIDIITHNNDGPLLLFPFNWRYRFPAPVSYWDAEHGGKNFTLFERLLDFAAAVYLAVAWRRRRRSFKAKEMR